MCKKIVATVMAAVTIVGFSASVMALELNVKPGQVKGTVTNSSGAPVEDFEMILSYADGDALEVLTTDEDGSFEMNLESKKYVLTMPSRDPVYVNATSDAENEEIVFVASPDDDSAAIGWWKSMGTTGKVAVVAGGAVATGGTAAVIANAADDDDDEQHP